MTPPPPSLTLFPYTTLFRSPDGRRPEPRADAVLPRQTDRSDQRLTPAHAHPDQRRSAGLASGAAERQGRDRKSTRLNSSHANISYAVFCLKKKKESNTANNT